ncbi:DUF397 domain-containing protein [Streptomyces sp. NRRL S-646]|uniref:DUF397 domain-containing protein n=1 Tax=Streptomyces sp. NRRL S-646 TaxID=1463917 RepID=UPI00099C3782
MGSPEVPTAGAKWSARLGPLVGERSISCTVVTRRTRAESFTRHRCQARPPQDPSRNCGLLFRVRDSKNIDGPCPAFGPSAWTAFVPYASANWPNAGAPGRSNPQPGAPAQCSACQTFTPKSCAMPTRPEA